MKNRTGFVSNSSSTSFIITNLTNEPKTLKDFVLENLHLIKEFNQEYNWHNFTRDQVVKATKHYDITWAPNEEKICTFGDEEGNALGHVYDYILRDGGISKSFQWRYHESCR